jgi:hypothetical protein
MHDPFGTDRQRFEENVFLRQRIKKQAPSEAERMQAGEARRAALLPDGRVFLRSGNHLRSMNIF